MSINNFGMVGIGTGVLTTLYGAYSYSSAKGQFAAKQRQTAKKTMLIGVGIIALGVGLRLIPGTETLPSSYLPPLKEKLSVIDPAIDTKIPASVKPYLQYLDQPLGKSTSQSLTSFPLHLSSFPHPGWQALKSGDLCMIPDTMPPLDQCSKAPKAILDILSETQKNTLKKELRSLEALWNKGFRVLINKKLAHTVDTPYQGVSFGTHKTIGANYEKAIQLAEKVILKNPNFCDQTPSQLLDTFNKIHATLTINTHSLSGSISPGHFRDKMLVVFDEHTTYNEEGMIKFLQKQGGTKLDIFNIKSYFQKMFHYRDFEKTWEHLSESEIFTLKKIVHIPSFPKTIASDMNQFAHDFLKVCPLVKEGKINPTGIAAWAHQQLGNIHPYGEANGRSARIFLNSVLGLGGEKSVIFPHDTSYTQAIVQDQKIPGYFSQFLQWIVQWNRAQKSLN